MNIFKKSFEIFKEKILILFLIKVVFVVLLFFFLVYAKAKLQSYLLAMQQYAPQIMGLQSVLQESGSASLLELENVLATIQPIIQGALIFTYFIVPLLVFLLWCFSGSLIYKLLNEEKIKIRQIFKNFWRFFLKFLIISLPFYLLLILLLYKTWQLFLPSYTNISLSIWQFLVFFLLCFFVFYFVFISYALLGKVKEIVKTFKKAFTIGVKKFYVLVPLFLPFFFILLLFLVLFFYVYVSFISNVLIFSSLVYALISLAILMILAIWYKIIIKLVLEKY